MTYLQARSYTLTRSGQRERDRGREREGEREMRDHMWPASGAPNAQSGKIQGGCSGRPSGRGPCLAGGCVTKMARKKKCFEREKEKKQQGDPKFDVTLCNVLQKCRFYSMQQQNIFSHIFINLIGLTAQLDICVCAIVENFFTYLPV